MYLIELAVLLSIRITRLYKKAATQTRAAANNTTRLNLEASTYRTQIPVYIGSYMHYIYPLGLLDYKTHNYVQYFLWVCN